MFKGESEIVFFIVQNKNLKKSDIVIVDYIVVILLIVWEEVVVIIEIDYLYLFSKVRVSFFKRKYFNVIKIRVFVFCKDKI